MTLPQRIFCERERAMRLAISMLLLVSMSCRSTEPVQESAAVPAPNFVVIFCDDLGYGDLGAFGHPTIRTPSLDRLASEGQRWTQFYVAASVCTPSRAGLMTGRLPIRSGMCSSQRRVLFPDSLGGLPESETTIAEVLKGRGYATAAIGKWHLGHLPEYLPTRHGFDEYFGIPYSNDMDRTPESPRGRIGIVEPKSEYFNVPLMRDEEIVERPATQETLTRHYTDAAIDFIERHREGPFFLYLAHSMPHVPLFRSKEFEGRSLRGYFGDVIEEIDFNVGRIIDTLRRTGLDENTIVVFTSDNGPWLSYRDHGGSAGLLRQGKGSTWEGGMRVPTIVWGPGHVKPGVVTELGSTLDLLPTFAQLAGAKLPETTLDGVDLSPVLAGTGPGARSSMIFYRGAEIYAARLGNHKAHWITRSGYGGDAAKPHDPPLLFDLAIDPSESHNLAEAHPEVIERIAAFVAEHRASVVEMPSELERR
ncbi:MAG: sulfatase [Planctomycetota bacterium]